MIYMLNFHTCGARESALLRRIMEMIDKIDYIERALFQILALGSELSRNAAVGKTSYP